MLVVAAVSDSEAKTVERTGVNKKKVGACCSGKKLDCVLNETESSVPEGRFTER